MSVTLPMPSPPAGAARSVLEGAVPVHARWSEANRDFLAFVARDPGLLGRECFAGLYANPAMHWDPMQPWPFFVDRDRLGGIAALAVGMDRLVKAAPMRFLDGDPARIAAYFRARGSVDGSPALAASLGEEMVALILEEPNGLSGGTSRGDYLETADGFRMVEYNGGRFLGGVENVVFEEMYLASEPVRRFLRESGRQARPQGVLRAYLRNVVDDTLRAGTWDGGDFNLAVVNRPVSWSAHHPAAAWERALRRALDDHGLAVEGRVIPCALDELSGEGGGVTVRGHPVHVVVDRHDGSGDARLLFRAFKLGMVNLIGGPVSALVGDKRTLALLSEHADSDDLAAGERELLARHLPWTRRVAPGRTAFRGRPFRIPDDLEAHREALVLKKGMALGGTAVEVGRYLTPGDWARAVHRALGEEDWVVQEYVEGIPYCFQGGDAGPAWHDAVWGLLVFGDYFGGLFLRVARAGEHGGVVNGARGAEICPVLETGEPEAAA